MVTVNFNYFNGRFCAIMGAFKELLGEVLQNDDLIIIGAGERLKGYIITASASDERLKDIPAYILSHNNFIDTESFEQKLKLAQESHCPELSQQAYNILSKPFYHQKNLLPLNNAIRNSQEESDTEEGNYATSSGNIFNNALSPKPSGSESFPYENANNRQSDHLCQYNRRVAYLFNLYRDVENSNSFFIDLENSLNLGFLDIKPGCAENTDSVINKATDSLAVNPRNPRSPDDQYNEDQDNGSKSSTTQDLGSDSASTKKAPLAAYTGQFNPAT